MAEHTAGGAPGWETRPYLRIATEEAYGPPELFDEYRKILDSGTAEIGFASLMGYFLKSSEPQADKIVGKLADLGEGRLADMDAAGVDRQVISLTSPGTQVLEPDTARWIAELSNDRIAEAVATHPSRFSGLAAVGLEDAASAIEELDRAIDGLGLKGLIVNSHVKGAYLDHPRFRPILEKVADLGVPLYLHPQTQPDDAIRPYYEAGLDHAILGFAAETGLHLLRLITSGTLDRVPDLRIVVGHLGEGIPYWLNRVDYMHAKQTASGKHERLKTLDQRPSEYFKTHIWLTTSGMPWEPAISFARRAVGADRVMFAMDYPYQFEPTEIATLDALPYSAAEKRQFFQGVAEDVFDL